MLLLSKVHHKLDLLGIGAQHTKDPNGLAWKQNRDFENLLRRLNAGTDGVEEEDKSTEGVTIDGFHRPREAQPDGEVSIKDEEDSGSEKKKSKKRKRDKDGGEGDDSKAERKKKRKGKKLKAAEDSEEVQDTPTPPPVTLM